MRKEHILVIRFSALGDVAMAVPVVWALANQYPDIRVTVLSRGMVRPLFEDLAPNVNFMEADLKQEYHGLRGLNALYRRLVAKQFTKVADLHNVLRSDYLRMRFNLGRYRVEHIHKHRRQRRQLTSYKNKVRQQLPTSFENYAEVFAKLGYPIQLDPWFRMKEFKFRFQDGTPSLFNFSEQTGGKPLIGIAPFAAHPEKIYPLNQMEKVVAQLCERHPSARLFFFGGGQQEMDVFHQWASKYPQCLVVGDHLKGLNQELALMQKLDVMVSMDSANMHLASLVGLPVVSVWGATHPYAGFAGYGQRPENAVQLDLPCRPCSIFGNKKCLRGDLACLHNISPELIINKVEAILVKR